MSCPAVIAKLVLKPSTEKLIGVIPAEIPLSKSKLSIGRLSTSSPNDFTLSVLLNGKNDIISRRHAEVTFTLDGQFVIRDLGALNGWL